MAMRLQIFLLGLIAFWQAPGAARADETLTIVHQGAARRFVEHRPSGGAQGRLPLLIYVHGLRPADWINEARPEINAMADRENVLVLYPEALQGRWNYAAIMTQPPIRIGDEAVDDVGFIRRLIADYVERGFADPSRVYATGDSRGGLMVYTLMCEISDLLAAAGPTLTGMTDAQVAACKPARATPLFTLAGTEDRVQSYDGWLYSDLRLLSVPETIDFWRVKHGCTGMKGELAPHRFPRDITRVGILNWTGCSQDGAIRFYRILRGGHQVPSGNRASPEWIREAGPQNEDIETIDEFWKFARHFTR